MVVLRYEAAQSDRQPKARSVQPTLEGTLPDPQHVRRLGSAKALEISEDEHFSVFGGKGRKRFSKRALAFCCNRNRLGVVTAPPCIESELHQGLLDELFTLGLSVKPEDRVAGNREKPGTHRRLAPKARCVLIRVQEGLLHGVLSRSGIAQRGSESEDRRCVLLDEQLERATVSLANAGDQVPV
jgi:hypothetical protein